MVELLSPSIQHEQIKKLLAQILEFSCFEKGVDYCGLGSTTYKRKALERGLEPDECYYFVSPIPQADDQEPQAPDLAIEVEISRSALDRLAIFAELGVVEVWRYTSSHELVILSLQDDGYSEIKTSRFTPFLTPALVVEFVQRGLRLKNDRLLLSELRARL